MESADGMSDEKRKTEPPLFLDMDFGEALARFTRVKPEDVSESIERSKQKKKPGDKAARQKPPPKGE